MFGVDARRWMFSAEAQGTALHLIPEALLMPMRPHAFATLVLRNLRFPPFLQRAHSDFQIRESRFNHLIPRVATPFFVLPVMWQTP